MIRPDSCSAVRDLVTYTKPIEASNRYKRGRLPGRRKYNSANLLVHLHLVRYLSFVRRDRNQHDVVKKLLRASMESCKD